ncbi:MAG TPA: LysR family transcriptional regulator [Ramlibacter sp.]|nr:LysR family transcriptional regulator [Ramlibacter sp.]
MDQFDLNLLRTLDALSRHRHLGRAAEELGVSQPALSHSLKRLREQLGDPLFVKTPGGMQPSARAVELAPVAQALLATVREQVLAAPEFDARVSDRNFTLAMSDIGELTFLPALLAQLTYLAPGLDVTTVTLPPRELNGALQRSEVDLVIGFFPDLDGTDVFQQRLFSHGFACLVSSSNPVARTELTREKFGELPHAVVHTEIRTHDIVEQYLREHGVRRRQMLRCPHFLSIPHVIAATNLVATVSESIARVLAANPQIAVLPAPYPFPRYDVKQHWHRCQHEDPGNRWLRALVMRLFGRPAP